MVKQKKENKKVCIPEVVNKILTFETRFFMLQGDIAEMLEVTRAKINAYENGVNVTLLPRTLSSFNSPVKIVVSINSFV